MHRSWTADFTRIKREKIPCTTLISMGIPAPLVRLDPKPTNERSTNGRNPYPTVLVEPIPERK